MNLSVAGVAINGGQYLYPDEPIKDRPGTDAVPVDAHDLRRTISKSSMVDFAGKTYSEKSL